MTKPKTLDQLRAEKERAETQLAQEKHMCRYREEHQWRRQVSGPLLTLRSESVGSEVKEGDVLFIIESMKLMNEVTSEFSGKVEKILVENGQAVEYGQPIMVIG